MDNSIHSLLFPCNEAGQLDEGREWLQGEAEKRYRL